MAHLGAGVRRGLRGPQSILEVGCDEVRAPVPLLRPAVQQHGRPVDPSARWRGPLGSDAAPVGPRGQPAQQRTQVVVDRGQVLTLAMSPTRAAAHAKPEEPWALWPRPAAARVRTVANGR